VKRRVFGAPTLRIKNLDLPVAMVCSTERPARGETLLPALSGRACRMVRRRLTHRWRGTDSNRRFRDAPAPPTALPWRDAA
jgi:hypothetical protein